MTHGTALAATHFELGLAPHRMPAYSRGMSNHPTPAPQPAPQTSTDRPTATYPTGYPHQLPEGWRVDPRPSRYLDPADPADAPLLAQADATPTGMFPTRRSIRPAVSSQQAAAQQAAHAARPEQATDAATTARTRPGTHACHTSARPSTDPEQEPSPAGPSPAVQDMGRPGILARPTMAWHPSLMQLAIGAALVLVIIGACNVAAINAHREARAYCHELAVSDWARAERECRGTGTGTPQPEQVPGAPSQPEQAAPTQSPASPSSRPVWTVHGTDAPYDRTDPLASPLDLPRCTTAPDTPLPCLASTFPQNSNENPTRVVVLEEDASLTGLDRQ